MSVAAKNLKATSARVANPEHYFLVDPQTQSIGQARRDL
jgi:hypothetical protein